MAFLQEASLRLEKRLVEAADRKATQLQKKRNNTDENGNGKGSDDNHMNNNNNNGRDDGRCADNFWRVINRARGLRSDESNIFGD